MDNQLDLTTLRTFATVVRQGSFADAARVLGAPRSTVSKRVQDLETQLGLRLIERTTRALHVTTEGEVLAARAEDLLAQADDIRRALTDAGQAPRGHLRIALPPLFGQMVAGRLAARVRALWPDITMELRCLDHAPDLLEEGLDGAIRFGPLPDSGQGARPLGTAVTWLVAAPAMPGLSGVTHPHDLADLPAVTPVNPWNGGVVPMGRAGETVSVSPRSVISIGSVLAVRDAVAAGAGYAFLPRFLVRPDIAAGRLVRLLPDWEGPRKTMYFVYPSPQSATPRLRAFLDVLMAEIAAFDPDDPVAAPVALAPLRTIS
jgi:DNA-binding transcriptional LysR family regulator